MIDYRPFRNTDPPAICEIWRNYAPLRALFQPMTPTVFENLVLSKPFFDRFGLIVAVENNRPIGFVHAGFAADPEGACPDFSMGATSMLMVTDHPQQDRVARELLDRSEDYLRGRGASILFGGGVQSVAPFYLGLYGGCRLPGILSGDHWALELYRDAGYEEHSCSRILHRDLAGFRPVVDRQQMQLRRDFVIQSANDPPAATWWEACTDGLIDRFSFVACPSDGKCTSARVVFWDMEPLASSWGVHARGLMQLECEVLEQREALTTFLIGESLKQLAQEGATLAEVHVAADDEPLAQVYSKLGFQEVEQAYQLVK